MDGFWRKVVGGCADALEPSEAAAVAAALGQVVGGCVYPESVATAGGVVLALGRRDLEKVFVAAWPAGKTPVAVSAFSGSRRSLRVGDTALDVLEGPCSAVNAAALRKILPWTAPQAVAGRPSIGLGDRLGLATPGHVRAVRVTGYVPMLAQQSIREMTRTRRSAQEVLDDATWGVFQTGFRTGFGADADHLKTPDDIDRCAAAGFTFYTIDPGDHVDNAADTADAAALATKFAALPWAALETTAADTLRSFSTAKVDLPGDRTLTLDETVLHRAAAKYVRAVAHTAAMHRHLEARLGRGQFELEVSVDETETPTSPAEHFYVARELARLGVTWVSLAPRFIGRFEKGVDYIGDLESLEKTFVDHLAIAQACGGYKLSLHSGSDKFSVYKMAARHAGQHLHVKTAGTSYLEALRVLARCAPDLFREILTFARERYEADKASYHVSADLAKMAQPECPADADLPAVLDQFDSREALHVTFGSVLTWDDGQRFRGRLYEALRNHEEEYAEALRVHIGRHLEAFLRAKPGKGCACKA